MNSEIYDFLSRKTNQQIVIEHINPYAYQCIPKNLAADIRSYHMDINLLDHMYNYYSILKKKITSTFTQI